MDRVFSQTFGVVGGILERGGKILLVREAFRKGPDHGKWNHPAGWIDVGEDPLVAVQREVREETGLTFNPGYLLGVYSLVRRDIGHEKTGVPHAIKLIFIGSIANHQPEALADDVSTTQWFTPDEIYSMDEATLRDVDIKYMVKDYLAGKKYPLDCVVHTVAVRT